MSAHLYLEGGGNSKEEKIRCREAFASLLKSQGYRGRMPRLTACGGRGAAFDDFKTAHATAKQGHYVGLLIDSEDPLAMPTEQLQQRTWEHLRQRDEWVQPNGATDDQVLFMTTCMETWIAADRETLRAHYGQGLNENQLPPTTQLESRHRHTVQDALQNATSACSNAYRKGKRSYEVLGKLKPAVLAALLPSFARAMAILEQKLEALPIAVTNTAEQPEMTPARAGLIFMMQHHLADPLHVSISIGKIHKLLYFMQEAQEPLGLRYIKTPSGPYADNLHDLVQAMDGHFIAGYDASVNNPGTLLTVLEGAEQQAIQFLAQHPATQMRCQKVCDLMSGFESPFGLDLLAPVHWLQTREQPGSIDELVQISRSWTPPMQRFTADEIQRASTVLAQQGWVQPLT